MTVVLVHGAWHGAWCWERVVDRLSIPGVKGIPVEMPGDGHVPGLLYADASAVRRVLDRLDGPVVLCGHSYGGAVITEAGVHPRVAHLVYIAAFVPDEQRAVRDLLGPGPRAKLANVGDDGLTHLDAVGVATLYHDCEPADVEWAAVRVRAQRPDGFTRPVPRPAWREKPSTYVVCTADQAIDQRLQRQMAARAGADVLEWPTGHSPFASRPDLVAALLADLSRRVTAGSLPAAGS